MSLVIQPLNLCICKNQPIRIKLLCFFVLQGAVVGSVFGLVLPFWISIGAYSVVGTPNSLPFPTENCSSSANVTAATNQSVTATTAAAM